MIPVVINTNLSLKAAQVPTIHTRVCVYIYIFQIPVDYPEKLFLKQTVCFELENSSNLSLLQVSQRSLCP